MLVSFLDLGPGCIGPIGAEWGGGGVDRLLAGSFLLNPLKMLIPNYAYIVWWVELFMTLVFFLATIALFLKWKPDRTLARCRARFSATTTSRTASKS